MLNYEVKNVFVEGKTVLTLIATDIEPGKDDVVLTIQEHEIPAGDPVEFAEYLLRKNEKRRETIPLSAFYAEYMIPNVGIEIPAAMTTFDVFLRYVVGSVPYKRKNDGKSMSIESIGSMKVLRMLFEHAQKFGQVSLPSIIVQFERLESPEKKAAVLKFFKNLLIDMKEVKEN